MTYHHVREDFDTIVKITERAEALAAKLDIVISTRLASIMDISHAHAQYPLDLERWLASDDTNFVHDFWGIRCHMDRSTCQLTDCFVPRFHVSTTVEDIPAFSVREIAKAMLDAFEPATRSNGESYWKLADWRPDWMEQVVFHAHLDQAPNDYRYNVIVDALRFLATEEAHSGDRDVEASEVDMHVSMYTHDLIEWVGSHRVRAGYVDEAGAELPQDTVLDERLAAGQQLEIREVFRLVREALEARAAA